MLIVCIKTEHACDPVDTGEAWLMCDDGGSRLPDAMDFCMEGAIANI